jgi:hypothetical protein
MEVVTEVLKVEILKQVVIVLVSLKIATLLQYPEDTVGSDEYCEQKLPYPCWERIWKVCV